VKNIYKNLSILENEFSDEFENSQRNKYLVLNLCGKEYAVEIRHVTEIIKPEKVVFTQNTAAGSELSIKYKNKIIPVIDLRILFNFPETEYNDKTAIIINLNEAQKALIADSVTDIEDIDIENSEKTLASVTGPGANYIKTACHIHNVVKNILNIEKLFQF